jgi:coenzyme F420-dependent glucose-6-phosphate dehydrogenase
MDRHVRISADPRQHVDWLQQDAALGFEQVYVHNVGRNQLEFIDAYGRDVLPRLSRGNHG